MFRPGNTSIARAGVGLQQVRYKRRLAYPRYNPQNVPKPTGKKDHASFFQRALKGFLGPKNIRGEYYRNKYYYPPQNHKPNYIVPNGQTVVDLTYREAFPPRQLTLPGRNPELHPFPQNAACRTASIIPDELKQKICDDINENGMHAQEVAHKYGIKLARIEAVLRLNSIEKQWQQENKIFPDLENFASVMYKMFPLYQPPHGADNLTEIPTPHKTLQQRFLTIAESEPFGPVDAAKILDLPVARDTLEELSQVNTEDSSKEALNKVIVGAQRQGERTAFKFTSRTSGDVGFRYGASRRDKRKDRSVGFDAEGRMVYI
ncbi:uncharacterized protein CANTADRAFT_27017 [Suhomyces tanzawaensis NRRL Y-17324]|uniref:37S ribosomal protein S35, mitochondrial n=1 Tax=Suhomyces tanzawaensis NRRL Y-17324 TaxID=984487 RepID=A0A1E4SEV8_9ASCO|nr:uncharacterized protein CANTADRAFT_27017 [Suhomyces tanzawaensis NRRL Y-17324]ODV78069.1 hypothetical protein CANTADRAFT_27017 [Suhomyces tanzawaensis NRRL Y-17324]